ncbi:MAG: FMN-binding protein [Candidatus Limivicinus sp.]|jgi:electron transport complex protein RnfG
MKIFKLAVVLLLICAIVSGVLGVVNYITKDKIAEQQAIKTAKAYASVLEAESYTDVDFDREGFPTVDKIAAADNGEGHVVMLTFSGAQGRITMAVGVDNEFKCSGISIISHSETSGLGANAASSSEIGQNFRAQFVGEGEDIRLSKFGGHIDALTGATITSRSVTEATATAIAAVESLQGGKAA